MWQLASFWRTHKSKLSFPECQHYMELWGSQNQAGKMLSAESATAVPLSKGCYSLISCNLTVQAWTPVARPHPQNFLRTPLNPASGGTTFREESDIQDQTSAWPVMCCLSYWKGKYCWKETFQWICTYCAKYREKRQRVWKKGRTSYFRGTLRLSPFPPWRKDRTIHRLHCLGCYYNKWF